MPDQVGTPSHTAGVRGPAPAPPRQGITAANIPIALVLGLALAGSVYFVGTAGMNSVVGAASGCRVSFDRYKSLRSGMSYEQAVSTLGCSGREMSRTDIVGTTTVMYAWDGSGSLGANMNAMFQGDRLISKAQFGMR